MNCKFKAKLLAIASMAFITASCSQDEMVENVTSGSGTDQRQEIEFHLDIMSRAADKTINNLDTIWVYADDGSETVFEATPFIKDEYGRFRSEEKIYWPDGKESLNFAAFWPDPQKSGITLQPGQATLNHEVSIHANKHCDLISATTTVNRSNYSNVILLNFIHTLAQIEIRAKIGAEATHRVDVYALCIVNSKRKGFFNFWNNEWSSLNTEYALYSAPQNVLTIGQQPQSLTSKTGSYYIIPQTLTYSNFNNPGKFNIVVYGKVYDEMGNQIYPKEEWKNTDLFTHRYASTANTNVAPLRDISECGIMRIFIGGDQSSIKFLPGHKYIYTIDFTNGVGIYGGNDPENPLEPILPQSLSVDVTVEDWLSNDFESNAN